MRYFFYLAILVSIVSKAEENPQTGHIGVVLQEAVGAGKTQTVAGHLAVVATELCADGILKVRRCHSGEPKGVIVSRYRRYSSAAEFDWMAIPLGIGLIGTEDYKKTPILTSNQINATLEMRYWREQLQEEIPALTEERKIELEKKASDRSVRRTLHYALTMGFISDIMEANQPAEKAQVVTDPSDGTIIPAGRWMMTLGIRNQRASAIVLVPSTFEEEEKLIEYLNALPNDKMKFKEIGSNCADFARDVLQVAFHKEKNGIQFPHKILNPGDVFGMITSPIMVTKGLLGYAEKNNLKAEVFFAAQLASTTPVSAQPRTISGGVLVPDASTGKTALIMRSIITKLNFWIPIGGLLGEIISRPPDLIKESHQRTLDNSKGEAIKLYGTDKCWKQAEKQFRLLIKIAYENGILSEKEFSALGKMKSGHVFPQRLEKQGMSAHYDEHNQMRLTMMKDTSGLTRENILDYQTDPNLSPTLALKIVLAAINFDLAAGPLKRRNTDEFDSDWQLLSTIAKDNGLQPPELTSISQCSVDAYVANPKTKDSLATGRSFRSTLLRSLKSLPRLFL